MPRVQSVDTLRVLAMVAVIAIHTQPFEAGAAKPLGTTLDLATLINQGCRFAVPFFFVISGYFWASKFAPRTSPTAVSLKMARRIAVIFVAWCLIYLLEKCIILGPRLAPWGALKVVYWSLSELASRPWTVLLQGTKGHLWFLTSLLTILALSNGLIARQRERSLLVLALLLYGIGLAGKAYRDTPIGFYLDFNFRDGPFFGLLLFVSGYGLQRLGPRPSWLPLGVASYGLGLGLQFFELTQLNRLWGSSMLQDYVVGTYFIGLGVALIALSDTRPLRLPLATAIAPLALGIYASHYLFIDLIRPLGSVVPGGLGWELLFIALVFLSAGLATYALSRLRLTRRLVA
jgi:surface polysaccharide O-acyltransferase-like enzyme